MSKTNKSFSKRVKITRQGKILIRKGGKIHFRAKQRRAKQLNQKRLGHFQISQKNLKIYLPNC